MSPISLVSNYEQFLILMDIDASTLYVDYKCSTKFFRALSGEFLEQTSYYLLLYEIIRQCLIDI
jgi:hypothetical protein